MSKKEGSKGRVVTADGGELRQDLVTGKWIVVATERATRPHAFLAERVKPALRAKFKDDCPFCRLDLFPQEPDVLRLPDDPEQWEVHIFPNKYPAFEPSDDLKNWKEGPYRVMDSVGFHEVLATRWHNEIDARLTNRQLALQLEALVLRFRQLRENMTVNYIQIIKNHGVKAGGSLEHPHHQLLTTPVLPKDVQSILHGAERFAKENGKDPYTVMIDFEINEKKRVVFENDLFVAFCPFASRVPFETWIVPKTHNPFFENLSAGDRHALAEVMREVFSRLYVGLNDPPYNYYVHSAPCDENGFVCDKSLFSNFRWHLQVLPRLNVWGGFELGTGLEITTALPEESASYLREQKVEPL